MSPGAGVTARAPVWNLCGQGARDHAGPGAVHSSGLEGEQLHAGLVKPHPQSLSTSCNTISEMKFYKPGLTALSEGWWHAEHLQ